MRESPDDMPSFAELAADPEIAALLDFEPVPRKTGTKDAWTPDLQRQFIALLAITGSPGKACAVLGKDRTGVRKLFDSPLGASFRAAWEGAVALAKQRGPVREFVKPGTTPPAVDHRFRATPPPAPPHRGEGSLEGEYDEPDPDEEQKWALMSSNEQQVARQAQFGEDAVEQAAWERQAHEEWEQGEGISRGDTEIAEKEDDE